MPLTGMRRFSLALLVFSHPAGAAEVNGYAVLTTDYVFRGVTYSDAGPAFQLGGEAAFENGLYGGVWTSTIDIESGAITDSDVKIDYYLGASREISSRISMGVAAIAYTFPGARGAVDYDYEEYSLSFNFDDRLWLEYAYSPDGFGSTWSSHNVEAYGEWPLPKAFSASAAVGHYDVSDIPRDNYFYWEIGVSRPVGRIELDLRYHDADRWLPIISDPERIGTRFALSARYQF